MSEMLDEIKSKWLSFATDKELFVFSDQEMEIIKCLRWCVREFELLQIEFMKIDNALDNSMSGYNILLSKTNRQQKRITDKNKEIDKLRADMIAINDSYDELSNECAVIVAERDNLRTEVERLRAENERLRLRL